MVDARTPGIERRRDARSTRERELKMTAAPRRRELFTISAPGAMPPDVDYRPPVEQPAYRRRHFYGGPKSSHLNAISQMPTLTT